MKLKNFPTSPSVLYVASYETTITLLAIVITYFHLFISQLFFDLGGIPLILCSYKTTAIITRERLTIARVWYSRFLTASLGPYSLQEVLEIQTVHC